MKAIIIDDEATARAIIVQLTTLFPKIQVIEEFSNAISAIKYLNQSRVDVVFLDIHMPDFTGFDFIKTLKNPPQIILITSDANFATEAFEYDCIVDYIVKPITKERFQKAINKLNFTTTLLSKDTSTIEKDSAITPNAEEFYVNIDRKLIKIEYAAVNVVEAKGDYIVIKTEKENYKVHTTLKKIEDKLPSSLFLKVHRSFIINTRKIIDIEDNSILIAKLVIPVSRSNRPELMKQLNLL